MTFSDKGCRNGIWQEVGGALGDGKKEGVFQYKGAIVRKDNQR